MCQENENQLEYAFKGQTESLGYALYKPDNTYLLHMELAEISGLSFAGNNSLWCVQDEKGIIYHFNLEKGEIDRTIKFGKSGDYEGLEIVGDRAYVVRNNGHIFSFLLDDPDKDKKEWDTPFKIENDVEGLGFDSLYNCLLIACKEKPEIKGEDIKGKAVYAFDLKQNKVVQTPVLVIQNKDIKTFIEDKKLGDFIKNNQFKPSAIAVHPITGFYYILASSGRKLIVLNRNKEIIHVFPLPSNLLKQPEGICFDPSGRMFISSEGQGNRGYILEYLFMLNKE